MVYITVLISLVFNGLARFFQGPQLGTGIIFWQSDGLQSP
jgi:hypothetical protein